uniref:Uncharacterized protein n=1 Tax=Branchiostoma floridae TaxID=7739 RepID=C3Y6D9_BRAFL|eukprot:XP_002607889.1 hypothetical protein BRAFLDRAFT_74842 [Branchiostoma floridae]
MVIKFTVEDFQMGPNGFLEIFDFCPYGRSVKILSGSVESSLDITNNAHEAFLEFSSNGLQITHGFNISYRDFATRLPGFQVHLGVIALVSKLAPTTGDSTLHGEETCDCGGACNCHTFTSNKEENCDLPAGRPPKATNRAIAPNYQQGDRPQVLTGRSPPTTAIQPPLGLQVSQENTGTRHRRSVAGLAIKTGLKQVASFVTDLLFNIAGLVFDIVGTVEGEQQHQEVMDKLNLLESKINGIHQEIQDLGIMDELLHEKEIAAQLYAASEQRIKNLHDTLQNRLQITINGTLEPVSLAQVWVETVLRQDSEGMNQALNNMHDMVMGTMTVFDGKSVVETMDALLRKRNHPNAAEKLKRICEYIIDLQLSGYVSWILALKQNGEMDRAKEVMNRADNKLSKQSCFIARFFYG